MTLHVIASAGALFSARRFSEAERMLSAAIARCADDDILEQLLYHRGRCLRKLALHAACAEDFSRVVHHGGKLASVARAYRGTALAELGLITLAVQDYTVALDERADDFPTRLNRGEALLNIGRAHEALHDVEVYVAAFPDNVDGRVLQGQANIALGRHAVALVELQRALQLEPGHPVATALYDNLRREQQQYAASDESSSSISSSSSTSSSSSSHTSILKRAAAAGAMGGALLPSTAAGGTELPSSSASTSTSTIDDVLISPSRRHLFASTPHSGPSSAPGSPERPRNPNGRAGQLQLQRSPPLTADAGGVAGAAALSQDDSFGCVANVSGELALGGGGMGGTGAMQGQRGAADNADVDSDLGGLSGGDGHGHGHGYGASSVHSTALKPVVRVRPAATMTALHSRKKRARTGAVGDRGGGSHGVVWGVVSVRQHHRELGGSGGVPINGGISLGMGNEHEDLDPINLDDFENKRLLEQRVPKELLEPASETHRRRILCDAMGETEFERRLNEEVRENKRLRASRDDSVINDSRMNPEFGTLQIIVPRENELIGLSGVGLGMEDQEQRGGGGGGVLQDIDREISMHTALLSY